jgi:hypothetical protein
MVFQLPEALVDLCLGQVGDLSSTVLNLAVGGLEAAQNAGALGDGVVAGQLGGGNAVQGAIAYIDVLVSCEGVNVCLDLQAAGPPGTHFPAAPLTVQSSCFRDLLGIQQAPLAAWRFSSSERATL